ncbi:class A beta-lactamase-related serine hydrolase [Solitalea sp. MAHUQ-68]|uniref:Class A beta-lactamase-related serine hydrolase n=1 Tax=Solitalea agri TaxID=2953739 RepID=A0A9X2F335_9SPHI|nr:serine hydrolase [Solitalea agri]MCO4293822.1 class A beta-lactamase-related serine hydrolase [Solitalea agri]
MKKFSLLLIISAFAFNVHSQDNSNLVEQLLRAHPELFNEILNDADKHEVQIVYTQINRDKNNHPSFKTYTYNVDRNRFFYAASTVKLPLALMSLEKINNLKIKGLTKDSPMKIDSASLKQIAVSVDTSAANGLPSISNYIKKILLVSDNDAYNRLYEFLGQQYVNETLKAKGFKDIRILNRYVVGDDTITARYTNPMQFYNNGQIVYSQPQVYNSQAIYANLKPILKGKGYLNAKDSLINQPFNFQYKNFYPLEEQQKVLRTLLFPETVPSAQRFNLTREDYALVYKYMSMLPQESKHPNYSNSAEYQPSYAKFLMFGDRKDSIPANIRIFNKIGDSYGYMIDNAYIVDFENKVEFMLSAVVFSNKDEIFNDSKYEYETICLPFLGNIGRVIYDYELNRKKDHLPDLSRFKMDYSR